MPRQKATPSRSSANARAATSWNSFDQQVEDGASSSDDGIARISGSGHEDSDFDDSGSDADFIPTKRKMLAVRNITYASESFVKGKRKKPRLSEGELEQRQAQKEMKRQLAKAHQEEVLAAKRAAVAEEKALKQQYEQEYAVVAARLAEFDYFVSVRKSEPCEPSYIKRLTLMLKSPQASLPADDQFWVYIRENSELVIYFEKTGLLPGSKKAMVLGTECLECQYKNEDLPLWRALSDISSRFIEVVLTSFDSTAGRLELACHLGEKAFATLPHPSSELVRNPQTFRKLMQLVLDIDDPEVPYREVETDIDDVYARISEERKGDIQLEQEREDNHNGFSPQHEQLLPRLRPYQKAAVRWMLEREKPPPSHDPTALHPLYMPITLADGRQYYYCPLGGWVVRIRPEEVPSPPGGILADEMGLGKTVEVLSLLLNHHRADVPTVELRDPVNLTALKEQHKQVEIKAQEELKRAQRHAKMLKREAEQKRNQQQRSIIDAATSWLSQWRREISSSSDDLQALEDTNSTRRKSASSKILKSNCEKGCSEIIKVDIAESLNESQKVKKVDAETQNMARTEQDFDLIEIQDDSNSSGTANCVKKKRKSSTMQSPSKKVRLSKDFVINFDPSDSIDTAMEATILRVCYDNAPPPDYLPGSGRKPKQPSATRQLLTKQYEMALAAISPRRRMELDEPEPDFSCLCGRWRNHDKYRVRCELCGTFQHAECVQYDVEDPLRGPYYCPRCWTSVPPVKSGATLIVSPTSISDQWVEEINKHIKREGMKVLVYTGVKRDYYLQPQTLANQDLIVTTYNVLQRELNFTAVGRDENSGAAGKRRTQRYLPPPTPLLCVDWWRLCLDEAQMVECVTTKTAEMALRLRSVNRWCVTGTPMTESVQDLYGLLYFLGVEPVCSPLWWQQLVYHPYLWGRAEPLHRLLAGCLWRTTKADVLDQIGVPAQTERTVQLQFSPVETYFYRRQQEECGDEALGKLAKLRLQPQVPLRDLNRSIVNQLLWPLLRLRQACCHPQVTRGQLMPISKSTLTMEQLLQQLIKRAIVDAEEAHRQRNAACNGLAALHVIDGEWAAAAELYRGVLREADQLRGRLHTDVLQRLHVLHNLAEVVALAPAAAVPPTVRDARLAEQAQQLRDEYMGKHTALVTAALKTARDATAETDSHAAKLDEERREPWFSQVMTHCADVGSPRDLVDRVTRELRQLSNQTNDEEQLNTGVTKRTQAMKPRRPASSLLGKFKSLLGLQNLLAEKLTELAELRSVTQSAVYALHERELRELTAAAVSCHLRPSPDAEQAPPPAECPLCGAHELFEQYERQLFFMLERRVSGADLAGVDGQVSVRGELQRGNWGDNETERVLKTLLAAGRALKVPPRTLQLAQHQLQLLETQKREFRALRLLWMRLRDRVSAADELEMAVLRLRLRHADEPRPPAGQQGAANLIEPGTVDQQMVRLRSDRVAAEADLRRRLGQQLYLSNLRRDARQFDSGNPDPCPICQSQLGSSWAVLHCGHCFCMQCIQLLVAQSRRVVQRYPCVACAVCRDLTRQHEIAYVSATTTDSAEQQADGDCGQVRVRGDHSTKVEGVVRCVLTILRAEPTAKTLVFASWTHALDVIELALRQNDVELRCLHGSRPRQQLREFKTLPQVSVLLLPVHSGANGLNIVEATHVILVNPTLDRGEERQAVGRVHRMGQTRPTTVHRLLVSDTIEERIVALNARRPADSVTGGDEEARLCVADLRHLLADHRAAADAEPDAD